MEKRKINIWPQNPMYFIVTIIIAVFALFLTGYSFYYLFWGEPTIILGVKITSRVVQFIIFFSIALMADFALVKAMLFKISIVENELFVPKRSNMQRKAFRINCAELLEYNILLPGDKRNGTIYQYLEFLCKDGKVRRLWIKPYTRKQAYKILQLIQDCGGLQKQNIEDFLKD